MAKRNTSIKINGKHYDALTGTPLKGGGHVVGKSMDAVTNRHSVKSATVASKPAPKPVTQSTAHAVAAHASGHSVKPSATLMRHAVKKPSSSLKRHAKVQGSTLSLAAPISKTAVQAKVSIDQINHQRLDRAKRVVVSSRVSRFSTPQSMPTIIITPTPAAEVMVHSAIGTIPSTETETSNDIFERALERATSHEEPAPIVMTPKSRARSRRRMASYVTGSLALLAVVAIISFQSVSVLTFKMASNRAGFAATMPAYRPAGYSVSKLQSSPGSLAIQFDSNADTDDSGFALTEKPSNWNSQTLLANIVSDASDTSAYNTIQAAGRTVYLYGKNQAAWVNNGILYQVLGHGLLTAQQLAAIAASM